MRRGSTWICLALVLLAGFLRFHRLGDWPYWMDEPSTLAEVNSLFGDRSDPPESQGYRLPRLIPVGYFLIHAGNSVLGVNEFNSRVVPALMGIAMVAVAFVLLQPLLGRATAVATALLIALWPAHVFHSQNVRFYVIAAFFASLAMLCGGLAVQRRSPAWTAMACASLVMAVLSHTLTILLLPILAVGVLAAIYSEDRRMHGRVLVVFALGASAVVLLYAFYLRPLLQGWNQDADFGYSVGHSILASINMLGWPISLLAGTGFVLMWLRRSGQTLYWLICAIGWAISMAVLPLVTVYHADYAFPLGLAGLVPAAYAIGSVFAHLRSVGAIAGVVWFTGACLADLPSLVSHYADGSRPDMRAAASYVQAHCQPGDAVSTFRLTLFRTYASNCEPATDLPIGGEAVQKLERLSQRQGRLWVLVDSTRGGLPNVLQSWLFENAIHRFQGQRKRLDYFEYTVDVFLVERGPR